MSQVCSNCLQVRDIGDFQEPTRSYKTCEKCRNNRKRKHSTSADLFSSEGSNTFISLIPLEKLPQHFATATVHQTEGYNYEAIISLNDTLLGLTDMEIAKLLCNKLGECDTYKYILKTVNPSTARKGVASFYANCSQSMALAKSKSIATYNRRRKSKQRKRFDCKGRVSASIDRVARQAHVLIEHEIRHEPPEPSRKTPNEVRDLIKRETVVLGRSAKDIHANVRQQFPNVNITPAQVYYWWREFKQEAPEADQSSTSTKKLKVTEE
ncbi:hypothetical protein BJV82DRAFT_338371 [Fennellomyces sp. T-0311]|nr:hypothetical protein BJV82DRAFT_338371 [Fennellomyces sp. T-0311]